MFKLLKRDAPTVTRKRISWMALAATGSVAMVHRRGIADHWSCSA